MLRLGIILVERPRPFSIWQLATGLISLMLVKELRCRFRFCCHCFGCRRIPRHTCSSTGFLAHFGQRLRGCILDTIVISKKGIAPYPKASCSAGSAFGSTSPGSRRASQFNCSTQRSPTRWTIPVTSNGGYIALSHQRQIVADGRCRFIPCQRVPTLRDMRLIFKGC